MSTELGRNLAQEIVQVFEGGTSDDPRDPGGYTKFGCSMRFAQSIGLDLDGDGDTDRVDVSMMTKEKAKEVFYEHFWKPAGCDSMPDALALCVYDCAVNQGLGAAKKLLGEAKRPGMATASIVRDFQALRILRYAGNKNWSVYGKGWMRRVCAVNALAGKLLAMEESK